MKVPKKEGHKLGDNGRGLFSLNPHTEMRDPQKRMERLYCRTCRKVTPHTYKGCSWHVDEAED